MLQLKEKMSAFPGGKAVLNINIGSYSIFQMALGYGSVDEECFLN
jgi:hypothetical protein